MTGPIPSGGPRARGRGRLILLLMTILVTGLVLVAGAGLLVVRAFTPSSSSAPHPAATPVTTRDGRDDLAAELMYPATEADRRSGLPALTSAPVIVVPGSTLIGPARLPSGFPHTPAGAIGQLAAIEISVLSQMSVPGTREIYTAWALPGAPAQDDWPLMVHVRSFLAVTGTGQVKDPTTTIRLEPVGAQTKANDGPDWTIACVLVKATVTIRTQAGAGFGYCERMQWDTPSSRWLIAPGISPALAPSTWPGTVAAQQAGWLTWADA
jgi:hypothetical protein